MHTCHGLNLDMVTASPQETATAPHPRRQSVPADIRPLGSNQLILNNYHKLEGLSPGWVKEGRCKCGASSSSRPRDPLLDVSDTARNERLRLRKPCARMLQRRENASLTVRAAAKSVPPGPPAALPSFRCLGDPLGASSHIMCTRARRASRKP